MLEEYADTEEPNNYRNGRRQVKSTVTQKVFEEEQRY